MSLLELPNELILMVGKHLGSQSYIKALMRTHSRMNDLLRKSLYATIKGFDKSRVFFWACKRGNLDLATEMLGWWENYGHRLHYDNNHTPLTIAAFQGHVEIVKLLLDRDPSIINEVPDRKGTAIVFAAIGQHIEAVKLLLSYPALLSQEKIEKYFNPPEYYYHCRTPINAALRYANEELFQLLMADSRMELNEDSLNAAVAGGNHHFVKLALKEAPNDARGRISASRTAVSLGNVDIFKILLEAATQDTETNIGEHDELILFTAAEHGQAEIVKILLARKNVKINGRDMVRRTPFSRAAEKGHLDIMKMLLQAGEIDVDSRDRDNRTPLSFAADEGEEEAVRLLLSFNAVSVDLKDNRSKTPLFYAAGIGAAGVVKMLLASGANPESRDSKGQTPLSYTVSEGKFRNAFRMFPGDPTERYHLAYLLQGRSLYVVDSFRNEYAQHETTEKPSEWDLKNPSKRNTMKPTTYNALEVMKQLLALQEVDPDSRDNEGRTPLSWAAEVSQAQAVELLLSTKVDVKSRDNGNWTPVQYAYSGARPLPREPDPEDYMY